MLGDLLRWTLKGGRYPDQQGIVSEECRFLKHSSSNILFSGHKNEVCKPLGRQKWDSKGTWSRSSVQVLTICPVAVPQARILQVPRLPASVSSFCLSQSWTRNWRSTQPAGWKSVDFTANRGTESGADQQKPECWLCVWQSLPVPSPDDLKELHTWTRWSVLHYYHILYYIPLYIIIIFNFLII